MEMLVVLFLFIIVLIASSDIFIRSQRAQYQAEGLQRLQDDARYVLNTMSADVRNGSIDYDCYSGACGQTINAVTGNTLLAVKNDKGRSRWYTISDALATEESTGKYCIDQKSRPCVLVSDNGGGTWQSMTEQGVIVDAAKTRFLIEPAKNPFALDQNNAYLSNVQPHVTIQFDASAQIRGARTSPRISVQTTVATREYKR